MYTNARVIVKFCKKLKIRNAFVSDRRRDKCAISWQKYAENYICSLKIFNELYFVTCCDFCQEYIVTSNFKNFVTKIVLCKPFDVKREPE